MPIKHVVMFRLKEDATADDHEAVKKGLLELPQQITCIQSYELGVDCLLQSGQTHPSGPNRTLSWTATFADAKSYEEYQNHPTHVTFVTDILGPVIEKGSRAAIQYEI